MASTTREDELGRDAAQHIGDGHLITSGLEGSERVKAYAEHYWDSVHKRLSWKHNSMAERGDSGTSGITVKLEATQRIFE